MTDKALSRFCCLLILIVAPLSLCQTLADPDDDAAPIKNLITQAKNEGAQDAELAVGKRMKGIADDLIKEAQRKTALMQAQDKQQLDRTKEQFEANAALMQEKFNEALQNVIKQYKQSEVRVQQEFDTEVGQLKNKVQDLTNEKHFVEEELDTEKSSNKKLLDDEQALKKQQRDTVADFDKEKHNWKAAKDDLADKLEKQKLEYNRERDDVAGKNAVAEKYHIKLEAAYQKMSTDGHAKDMAIINDLKDTHQKQLSALMNRHSEELKERELSIKSDFERKLSEVRNSSKQIEQRYSHQVEELSEEQGKEAKLLESSQSTAAKMNEKNIVMRTKIEELQREESKAQRDLQTSHSEAAAAEKRALLAQQQEELEKAQVQKWEVKEHSLEEQVLSTRDLITSIRKRVGASTKHT